ncbi:putative NAD(FAD)-dependent dehydrogenase [Pyrobaculum oguniense TE7]|uniref:NAD(FAD)-dependent dehydrogenase n=1 Tax=Pyrobaculum oguniense (strain DSM 13380 / JCM 10595 / TE7) TaxID=698757 RepID=H6Q937_PYROT|nr:putative NAD(FAD)-dependent dehydrogenase [Pyrobaculum oguniense TE7]
MKRREFLATVLAGGAAGFLIYSLAHGQRAVSRKTVLKADVVVVGGGVAGSTVARLVSPHLRTVVVEPRGLYLVGPAKEDITLGLAGVEDYAAVRRGVFRAAAVGLDPGNRLLYTTAGLVEYRYLVLAVGVRLAYEEAEVTGRPDFVNIYDDDSVLGHAGFLKRARGRIVIAHPGLPYRCTSAPYELAFLADYIAPRPHDIVVISGVKGIPAEFQEQISQLGGLVNRLMEERGIGLVAGAEVVEVGEGRVLLDNGEAVKYDVLIWTPPHRGWPWLVEAGVARESEYGYVRVDDRFRTRWDDVYAVGDVVWHVVKTGWAAYYEALATAAYILEDAGFPSTGPEYLYSEDSIRLEPRLAIRGAKRWWPIYGKVAWRQIDGPSEEAAEGKYAWMRAMRDLIY